MRIEIVETETKFKLENGEYSLDDTYFASPPDRETYIRIVQEMAAAVEAFEIRSQFRDSSALWLSNTPDDDPCWILVLELSNRKAMNLKTVEYIWNVIQKVDTRFSALLRYEYNYVGIDFSCIIEHGTARFCFNDEDSQAEFQLNPGDKNA